MEKIQATARRAADAAGKILREKLGNLSQIDYKSAFNIVTDADKASEAEIIRIIHEDHPDHHILGEESGAVASVGGGAPEHRWIIDPLDGTTNYAHAYPFFSVSIGFEQAGQRVFGLVLNPVSGELFWGARGAGAWLGEKQIRVSTTADLSAGLLATGFPPDTRHSPHANMKEFQTITDMCHGVRRDGSAALDLCFVACGRFDGFWEFKLAPWDLAAGTLIIEEAGGKVTSIEGGAFDMSSGHVLATNGHIHQQLVDALEQVKSRA